MRFANLKTATRGGGGNRCQGIAFNATPPRGILTEHLLQKLPRESEVGTHGILKLFAVKSAVQRREYAPVEQALHLLAGVAGRNQIEPQIQHRLNQLVNPSASDGPGGGGNYATKVTAVLPPS